MRNNVLNPDHPEVRAAVELYRKFREREPERIRGIELKVPKMLMSIGRLNFVGYTTTHGKETVLYKHVFDPVAEPLLTASADGRQLFIIGGRYNFTEDGIVDRDIHGREIRHNR